MQTIGIKNFPHSANGGIPDENYQHLGEIFSFILQDILEFTDTPTLTMIEVIHVKVNRI